MIKNDRQYRLTKGQLEEFKTTLNSLENATHPSGLNPELIKAYRSSLTSQVQDLNLEIQEYEALSSGKMKHFVLESFDELPSVLIRARIARGFTQKKLAEKLKIKEQQVQRWEANDYAGASIETLKHIVGALGVEVRKEFFVPDEKLLPKLFLANLTNAGIPKALIFQRLFPSNLVAAFQRQESPDNGFRTIVQAASLLSRVFSLPVSELLKQSPPKLNFGILAATRFKLPANVNKSSISAYTLYAHYLAAIVATCFEEKPKHKLITDWHKVHAALTRPGSPMTFSKVIHLAWDCGILVLPLRDAGSFHGAVWKIEGRFVIVLKQTTPLASRWLYDLLHEIGHIVCGHVTEDAVLIENTEISPASHTTKAEDEANEWAEDALFDGESDQIEQACVAASEGKMQKLKAVLPAIAKRYDLSVGALANHMAYRLAAQKQDWWGTAHNLQLDSSDSFDEARRILLGRISLHRLPVPDRELLMRALTEE
jgi:transcriptional regulator with XRE-family HTH domain/Zn-dependent peptidase ImmA (M78 family)